MNNEPELLLLMELAEPQTYYSLLQAIARGNRPANENAQFAGIETASASSYLRKLRRLRLVTRDIPVTANLQSTRKSRYRLSEPFFRFWFRFLYGQQDRLTMLGDEVCDRLVEPVVPTYFGPLFEIACQNALPELVPASYHGVGYWWHCQHELDEGVLVVGECKYTTREMTGGALAGVEDAAAHIDWTPSGGDSPESSTAVSVGQDSPVTSRRRRQIATISTGSRLPTSSPHTRPVLKGPSSKRSHRSG